MAVTGTTRLVDRLVAATGSSRRQLLRAAAADPEAVAELKRRVDQSLGGGATDLGGAREADRLARLAERVAAASGDARAGAIAAHARANAHHAVGRHDRAVQHYQQAIDGYRASSSTSPAAR